MGIDLVNLKSSVLDMNNHHMTIATEAAPLNNEGNVKELLKTKTQEFDGIISTGAGGAVCVQKERSTASPFFAQNMHFSDTFSGRCPNGAVARSRVRCYTPPLDSNSNLADIACTGVTGYASQVGVTLCGNQPDAQLRRIVDEPWNGLLRRTVSDEYGSASDSSSSIEDISKKVNAFSEQNIQSEFNHNLPLMTNGCQSKRKTTRLTGDQLKSMNLCKEIWRKADAVCFDVDSTVCCDEAIDELAKYVGKSKEVSDITRTAMLGGANFREALAKRLEIIQPSTKILTQYLQTHKPRLTPYIEELVARLHSLGVDVYLISGGFDVIIQPAAKQLNIPFENVFANSIKFYYDGSYAGFDKSRPTSNQDGKSRVIAMLKQTKGYKSIVMIGDGVTDLEACPPADAFIGFGGNQVRETVRDNSDWFVHSFKELITELPYCGRNMRAI